MFDIDDLESNGEIETVAWLKKQDDLYENEGNSEVDDATYDRIRRWAELSFPANTYFAGTGSDVRGGKIKLPYSMSGLTQVHEGGETSAWAYKIGGNAVDYVASAKMDGTSAMVVYDPDGNLQKAYSRGNTTEGADITRHIKRIHNIPTKIPAPGRTTPIRMEIEFKKSDWPAIEAKFTSRSGEPYKNARNAVAGIMNASTNPDKVYEYLNGIAYTIMNSDQSKENQLDWLHRAGFEIVEYQLLKANELDDQNLTNILNKVRSESDYELDGIVIDVDNAGARKHALDIGQPTTVKYKVADAANNAVAIVKEVVYRASKDGYLKPRVNIHPVKLVGVTINFATGFNAKFIKDNNIGPGAKIRITRSGDVIPFIIGTVEPASAPQLPDSDEHGNWHWTTNDAGVQVDAVLDDVNDNKGVAVLKMVDIFTKLKVPHLKQGSIEKLYDAGFKTPQAIMNAEYTDLYMTLGENGAKIDDGMDEVLTDIYWPEFVGSLNIFGRGISRKKLTSLYDAVEGNIDAMRDLDTVCSLEGFDEKTARPIVEKIDEALQFIDEVKDRVTLKLYQPPQAPSGDKMAGQSVVFTGVRSAEMERKIVEEGGELKNTISNKVTLLVCKDVNSNSGKAKKARQLGIKIVDLNGLEKLIYG